MRGLRLLGLGHRGLRTQLSLHFLRALELIPQGQVWSLLIQETLTVNDAAHWGLTVCRHLAHGFLETV